MRLDDCYTDVDDWGIQPHIFQWINNIWGSFTIDGFATSYDAKYSRFNFLFWNPGREAIDAFLQDWKGENNWVVPPPCQIIQVWRHFQNCQARRTLIFPLWRGAVFCPNGINPAKCVTDWVGIPEFSAPAIVGGRTYNSIFHEDACSSDLAEGLFVYCCQLKSVRSV